MNKESLCAALLSLLTIVSVPALASPAIRGLDSPGAAPEWAAKLMLFGQFAGDWECDVVQRMPDGSKMNGKCEWHFGWTLEGRAIQDVWIARYGALGVPSPADAYGTTLRWYDPKSDIWHAIWINARANSTHAFTARKSGDEIVLESQENPEHPFRWIFSEITPQSFHWRSEGSPDSGKTWILGQEMSVRRVHSGLRDAESDRQAIEKLEREWLDRESDRGTLERVIADDFVHPVPNGIFLTKRQHIDWSVEHPRPTDRKARFEKLDVRLYGDSAIATGVVDDTDAAGGDSRRTIFTDVFAYRNGAWQAVNAQENAIIPNLARP